ncbi:WXG100 family type VII secretion target [Plantactinospora sp. BB1]|uniref:WXG100 family type VII secretion target n=1 Tax=Plantactinospora sp. BB1 TaxID=2071627 RepID=UPI000D151C14|nr:hypothetical protein [Plantactinospora sp. BB1]AVT40280.1 hypothetical protein C6W10_31810 [Plantactinospora sp. BB1]
MTLAVEAEGLNRYARQILRARDDVTAIREYLGRYADAGTGGELHNLAKDGHENAVRVVDGTLNRLMCLLDVSAPELDRAAAYYRRTDLDSAARVDRTLPDTASRAPTPLEAELAAYDCPPPPFSDARQVSMSLVEPGDVDKPPNALGWMDYISPSSWANAAFDAVFGFDPLGWVQERVFGDWEALARMEPVVTNVGGALHAVAQNVQTGATALTTIWQGDAGNAAYRYFTDLANAASALRGPLDKIGDAYRGVADAVWAIGEALTGVIKALLDAAIIAGIAIAAGTATSWTGVGAVAGYGVAAAEIAYMLRLWGQATALYQNLSAAVNSFRALLGTHLSGLESVTLPALPGGGGYDHPLVQR